MTQPLDITDLTGIELPDFPFVSFPKLPRLNRGCVITEKLDGTNAQVVINDDGDLVAVGSRNRWIAPGKTRDNAGFALHVYQNRKAFEALGPGTHFGEWWGKGIQRGYGLDTRYFSLFNTGRWSTLDLPAETYEANVRVVPVLFEGPFSTARVDSVVRSLREFGSRAVPGFEAEGVVVYLSAAQKQFKVTCKNDGVPKGLVDAA